MGGRLCDSGISTGEAVHAKRTHRSTSVEVRVDVKRLESGVNTDGRRLMTGRRTAQHTAGTVHQECFGTRGGGHLCVDGDGSTRSL